MAPLRQCFLRTFDKQFPDAFPWLFRDLDELFAQARDKERWIAVPPGDARLNPIEFRIQQWIEKWNLTAPWLHEWAAKEFDRGGRTWRKTVMRLRLSGSTAPQDPWVDHIARLIDYQVGRKSMQDIANAEKRDWNEIACSVAKLGVSLEFELRKPAAGDRPPKEKTPP
jgi:hypothetical protein